MPVARPPAVLLRQHDAGGGRASHSGRDALAIAGIVPENGRLTVTRQSSTDVGFREIFVSIDGKAAGMLRFGDELSVELSAGAHYIRAHNTLFWKTHQVTIRPGDHLRFEAINRAGWGTFGMLFVIGAMPVYLTFERVLAPLKTKPIQANGF